MKKVVVLVIALVVAMLVVWKVAERTPAATQVPAGTRPHVVFGQLVPQVGGGASLHGRVSGRASVALIETSGAPVVVARQEGEAFDFTALAAGRYCVVATAGPRAARACDLVLGANERRAQDLVLARESASLHGTVADAEGGVVARPAVWRNAIRSSRRSRRSKVTPRVTTSFHSRRAGTA